MRFLIKDNVQKQQYTQDDFCEIDYVFILKAEPDIHLNPSEVECIEFVGKDKFEEWRKHNEISFWFDSIMRYIDVYQL